IRIEVILAGKDGRGLHAAAERQCGLDRVVNRDAVEDRERARETEADGTDLRIRRCTEVSTATAEDLGGRTKLRVDLQSDDSLVANRVVHSSQFSLLSSCSRSGSARGSVF